MKRALPLLTLLFACAQADTNGLGNGAGQDLGPAPDLSSQDSGNGSLDAQALDLGAPDGGQPDMGVNCMSLTRAACEATPECLAVDCGCGGQDGYIGCFGPGDPIPTCEPCPPPCAGLNETECLSVNADCEAHYCTGCDGIDRFSSCALRGEPVPGCPPIACPCMGLDEAACAAAPDCHRVFGAPAEPCACPTAGCCHSFQWCADGATAYCEDDNLACRQAAPFCDGPYVVSYAGNCYEGCALQTECQ